MCNYVFDPHFNNRMPVYVEKVLPKFKRRHFEIKDGKRIFVDGAKPNPYKGIDGNSLSLSSRIKSGTFENHEGSPRELEKAVGSDVLSSAVAAAENEFNSKRTEYEKEQARKRSKEELDKVVKKMINNNNNN